MEPATGTCCRHWGRRRRGSRRAALGALMIVAISCHGVAASDDGAAATSRLLARAGRLDRAVARHLERGKLEQAIAAAGEALELRLRAYGRDHPAAAWGASRLGDLYTLAGRLPQAEELYRRSVTICERLYGPAHPQTAIAQANLARLLGQVGSLAEARALYRRSLPVLRVAEPRWHRSRVTALWNAASLEEEQGQYAEAFRLGEEALEVLRTSGRTDPELEASIRGLLGRTALYLGRPGEAEGHLRESLRLRRSFFGLDHYNTATSLENLASLLRAQGEFEQAESMYRASLAIHDRTVGREHPERAQVLNNLGLVYFELGDLIRAEQALVESYDARLRSLGAEHRATAESLHNLGSLYFSLEDFSRAEAVLLKSVAICEKNYGRRHPETTLALNSLGLVHWRRGELPRARALLEEVLDFWRDSAGEDSLATATAMHNLALVLQRQGDLEGAEALVRTSLAIRGRHLGGGHPQVAHSLNSLALILFERGDPEAAEELLAAALDRLRSVAGGSFVEAAYNLGNLAILAASQGDWQQAERLAREALEVVRNHLDRTFSIQSERQQLAITRSLRERLDLWLAVARRTGVEDEAIYQQVLAWKGAVFRTQARTRRRQQDEAVRALRAEMRRIDQLLAAQAWQPEGTAVQERQQDLDALLARRERLQRDHAAAAPPPAVEISADAVRRSLSPGTVLFDFLEYGDHFDHRGRHLARGQHRMVVFVVRPDAAIRMIDLGSAEEIGEAVEGWLRAVRAPAWPADDGAAQAIRELLWQPLQPVLEDLGSDPVLLFSPDGSLGALPPAVIPVAGTQRLLLEEAVVAVVPFPQLLAAGRDRPPEPDRSEPAATMLLAGDVDYGASPTPLELPFIRPQRSGFEPLPGTAEEIRVIEQLFARRYPAGRMTVLRGGAATEAALTRAAGASRWLHIATHGFFAETVPGRLAGEEPRTSDGVWHGARLALSQPGLRVGLALAGANARASSAGPDGLLTAFEVSSLDLSRLETVVLSACETALGESAGGEGTLGLQRAFHGAGAASVVASSWRVPDRETSLLMAGFYDNLWQRKQPVARALRQAQLALLDGGSLGGGDEARGTAAVQESGPPAGARVPPYYWGAFTVSSLDGRGVKTQ